MNLRIASLLLALPLCILPACSQMRGVNPVVTQLGNDAPAWTNDIQWTQKVSIKSFAGASWDEKLVKAQASLASKGGGVVYFPPGTYEFTDNVTLQDGVVLMGEPPARITDARSEHYQLNSRLSFPLYKPSFTGTGTPNDTAFKQIRLANPASDSNCGVVYLAIDGAHLHLAEGKDHQSGRNRVVMGNILTHTAYVASDVPRASVGQPLYHRWTARHRAAITVHSAENLLIASNRLPESEGGDFEMPNYALAEKTDPNVHDLAFNPDKDKFTRVVVPSGIIFDYDNRPGIYANDFAMGSPGDGLPNGTPETHPAGFRKGIVIRDNYIFAHGRCPISFSGDGTIVKGNVIRIPKGLQRPTCRGFETSGPGSTNDNRAIQCRGYRYVVEDNDYEVYSSITYGGKHLTCDGEGIMHENHMNAKVLDSRIANNRGNAYICLWRVEIDGLDILNNTVTRAKGTFIGVSAAISIKGRKRFAPQPYCPVRNLRVEGNTISAGALELIGEDKGGNVARNNRSIDDRPAMLVNENSVAKLEGNVNFRVIASEAEAAAEAKRAATQAAKSAGN